VFLELHSKQLQQLLLIDLEKSQNDSLAAVKNFPGWIVATGDQYSADRVVIWHN
jgi:hypothetical protein